MSKRQEISAGEDVGKGDSCALFGKNVNSYSHHEKQYGGSQKVKDKATI